MRSEAEIITDENVDDEDSHVPAKPARWDGKRIVPLAVPPSS